MACRPGRTTSISRRLGCARKWKNAANCNCRCPSADCAERGKTRRRAMSFWKNLFGGGSSNAEPEGDKVMGEESHKGFLIKAIEMRAGGELQLAGTIEKDVGGELKTYRFIRADRM